MSSETLPIVGKRYNAFNDGKIRISRLNRVYIYDVLTHDGVAPEVIQLWNEAKEQCSWLFAKETDRFICAGHCAFGCDKIVFFARSVNGGWYGIDENLRLDIDGSLSASIGLPPFPA